MPPTVRDHLQSHPPRLLEALHVAPGAEGFEAATFEVGHRIVCECGGEWFRVLGVPETMLGGTRGYLLRSVLRVWRELRAAAAGQAGVVSRLSPPIALDCTQCGARLSLVPANEDGDVAVPAPPLEALRCRPCRRSTFAAAVLRAYHDVDLDAEVRGGEEECYDAWRLAVRCGACGTQAEPFARELRGEQERRIDRLYGREAGDSGASARSQEEPRR